MRKRIAWLLVSSLLVLALVLVSCGPAVTEEEEEEVVTEEEEEEVAEEEEEEEGPEMARDSLGRLVEKPRYGGVFTSNWTSSPRYWDETQGLAASGYPLHLTNEPMVIADWTMGPTGTGEALYVHHMMPVEATATGNLAESWELVDDQTMVFHIRKGVHFHDKPPANGREMDAYDVVHTIRRLWEDERSFHRNSYGFLLDMENTENSVYATDKWTVVIKCVSIGRTGQVWSMAGSVTQIVPQGIGGEDGAVTEWTELCGTGPFILTDYVMASSLTFERNPNYWGKDPFHPDNQLPYLDGVKWLIIPDASTILAALRVAKLDRHSVLWEEAEALMQTNPELKWLTAPTSSPAGLHWRVDKPELPFYDKRVRQALWLAIDNEEIAESYYGGEADVLCWPIMDIPEFKDMRVELENLPESTRELYGYYPDKAQELLAEAGYPNGFKTEIVCTAAAADLLSIIVAYWADVGVELELNVKEIGAFYGTLYGRTYTDIIYGGFDLAGPWWFGRVRAGDTYNMSMVNDSRIEEVYKEVTAAFFDEPKKRQLIRDIIPYMLDQAYLVQLPGPYVYQTWQPWVKGYSGEITPGHLNMMHAYPKYIWIDQDLKEEMTGQR